MPTTYPPSATADARNRAWRTFVQGLLVDIVLAIAGGLSLVLSSPDFAWTGAYWTAVGLALAKTTLTTIVAYVMRKAAPPAVS
jgi:hypothetical protein